jgi:hypothetical protein
VTTLGGTTNTLAKFTGSETIGDSRITDDGSSIDLTTDLVNIIGATSLLSFSADGVITSGSSSGNSLFFFVEDAGVFGFQTPTGAGRPNFALQIDGEMSAGESGNFLLSEVFMASLDGADNRNHLLLETHATTHTGGGNNFTSLAVLLTGSDSANLNELGFSITGQYDTFMAWNVGGGADTASFDLATLTADRTYTFPNATGTVAVVTSTPQRLTKHGTVTGVLEDSQLEQTSNDTMTMLEGSTLHNTTLEIQGSDNFGGTTGLKFETPDFAESFFRLTHESSNGDSIIESGGSLTILAGTGANSDTFQMLIQGKSGTNTTQIRLDPLLDNSDRNQVQVNSFVSSMNGNDMIETFRVDPDAWIGGGTHTGSNNFVVAITAGNVAEFSNVTEGAFQVEGSNYDNAFSFVLDPVNPHLTRTDLRFTTPTAVRTITFPDASGTVMLSSQAVEDVQAETCPDSGDGSPGVLTLTPTAANVQITNADADGCTVTMGEGSAVDGERVGIIIISNAGITVDFADTSGVSELAGPFTMDLWDSLDLRYTVDRWVERGRSDN